jgi:hypothetical protein
VLGIRPGVQFRVVAHDAARRQTRRGATPSAQTTREARAVQAQQLTAPAARGGGRAYGRGGVERPRVGEVSRARVSPAHRDGVRRFLGRFARQGLEVALEATTDWRFLVEELQAIGAEVHLVEPAETSSLRDPKKRAKIDRADARHLREC